MTLDLRRTLMAVDAGGYARIGDTGYGQVWNDGRLVGRTTRATIRCLLRDALISRHQEPGKAVARINQAGRDVLWGLPR